MSGSLNFVETLSEVDWEFRNLVNEGVHSFHWYPATFLSAIPGTLIPVLSRKGATILDPFCGTSTTGIEAIRLGRKYVGFDTNPIAISIAFAKHYFPDPRRFQRYLDLDDLRFRYSRPRKKRVDHPQKETLLRWYHEETYREIRFLIEEVGAIGSTPIRKCAQSVLSSVLKSTSSQSRHWGWVCDNVTPKEGEIQYKDAILAFQRAAYEYLRATDQILQDYRRRNSSNGGRMELRKLARLECEDSIVATRRLEAKSIDLILTSPPYYGVADYVKSQRLSFLWFDHPTLLMDGHSFGDFDSLRQRETGSRSHRHRKDSFDSYVRYMSLFFQSAQRVLKRNGRIALVIGESSSRTATVNKIIEIAKDGGFALAFRSERDIKLTRRRLMAKVPSEEILIFSKQKH